jgi:hypothetical protein
MPIQVNDLSPEAKALRPRWAVVDALLGGTWTMRAAQDTYLHRWPQEDQASFEYRLQTSTLFNAFARTIENMASKPFSEPIKWSNIDATVEAWFDNIDLQGRNLHVFCQDVFKAALSYGLTHILVDYPPTIDPQTGKSMAPTLADERNMGVRPYFVHLKPSSILGWITTKANGNETLTQVRIMECVTEPEGAFGTKQVKQVRVLEPGKWSTYRKNEKDEDWSLYQEGLTTQNYIPLVTFYAKRTGFMTGEPVLSDLADLNIQHWNLCSDSDNLLHTASVPILTISGVDDQTKVVVGAKAVLMLPLGATAGYTEHTGAAIDAGRTRLKDLEESMRTMGAELLVSQPGDMTATQSSIETAQAQCQLAQMTQNFGDVIDQAIDIAASWVGLADQGEVDIFDEFATPIGGVDVQAYVAAMISTITADLLDKERAFHELQRRNIISPDLKWEVVAEKIGSAQPVLQGQPMVLGKPAVKPVAVTEE